MNILAIGAHPDDIEINCIGTLAKLKKEGHKIFLAVSTSGNQGSNEFGRTEIAEIRKKEAIRSAEILGAQIRFMDFDDEGLVDTIQTRREFINTIRWANPDLIFTHHPDDKSTDHGMTGEIVTRVLLSLQGKNIIADEEPIAKLPSLFYADTGAGIDFVPEIYVDITKEMDLKTACYSQHVSQLEWMKTFGVVDFKEYITIISGYRGIQAGVRYAEGFIGCKLWSFMSDFRLLP